MAKYKKGQSQFKEAEQLAMFMTSGDLLKNYHAWPGDRGYVRDVSKIKSQMELPLGDEEQRRKITMENVDPDVARRSSSEETWAKKLEESRNIGPEGETYASRNKPSLHESIKKAGVLSPVNIQAKSMMEKGQEKPFVTGGHHRIAAAADVNPNMLVPVSYYKDPGAARKGLGERAYVKGTRQVQETLSQLGHI